MRSCWPSRYSVSTVSSVRQTIRLGGNIKPPPTHQPDGNATNVYELDTQPLPGLSSFGRLPTAPAPRPIRSGRKSNTGSYLRRLRLAYPGAADRFGRVGHVHGGSRPSSWWKFETEGEASRVQRRWVESARRSARWRGARSTAWRIVMRPERRYQALRLWRTAARLRGLTAALRPSVGHSSRSTTQWIA